MVQYNHKFVFGWAGIQGKTIDKLTTVVLVSGIRVMILRIMRRSAPADKYTSYTRHRKCGNFLTCINSANVHLYYVVM